MSPEEFMNEMKRRQSAIKTDLGRAVVNSCQLIENTAKKGMTQTETDPSKAYKRGDKTHYASVEFDYPAVDRGRLRQSITHDVGREGGDIVGYVGTNVKYGAYLEFGTSKMTPRPWLKPSIAINREKIHNLIFRAVKGDFYESAGE